MATFVGGLAVAGGSPTCSTATRATTMRSTSPCSVLQPSGSAHDQRDEVTSSSAIRSRGKAGRRRRAAGRDGDDPAGGSASSSPLARRRHLDRRRARRDAGPRAPFRTDTPGARRRRHPTTGSRQASRSLRKRRTSSSVRGSSPAARYPAGVRGSYRSRRGRPGRVSGSGTAATADGSAPAFLPNHATLQVSAAAHPAAPGRDPPRHTWRTCDRLDRPALTAPHPRRRVGRSHRRQARRRQATTS